MANKINCWNEVRYYVSVLFGQRVSELHRPHAHSFTFVLEKQHDLPRGFDCRRINHALIGQYSAPVTHRWLQANRFSEVSPLLPKIDLRRLKLTRRTSWMHRHPCFLNRHVKPIFLPQPYIMGARAHAHGSFIGVSMNIYSWPCASWVHTCPYFSMGVCAPKMYGAQGFFFDGKGVLAPTT